MSETTNEKRLAAAALGAAALGSICCLGPLAAAFVGMGVLGAASGAFEPARPYLLGAAGLLLAAAMYRVYRKPAGDSCAGGVCAPGPSQERSRARLIVWLAAAGLAAAAVLPRWAERSPAAAAEAPAGGSATAVFAVEGMTCPSCAAGVQATLSRRTGVASVVVDLESGEVRVAYDAAQASPAELEQAIRALGYASRLTHSPGQVAQP